MPKLRVPLQQTARHFFMGSRPPLPQCFGIRPLWYMAIVEVIDRVNNVILRNIMLIGATFELLRRALFHQVKRF
jgi:hypothetical protein